MDSKGEGKIYGKYSFYGGGSFYLYGFDFYIKKEDFKFFCDNVNKLKIYDEFKKDRVLLACKFWSRSINAPTITLLLDLTNRDIFVYDDEIVYYLEFKRDRAYLDKGGRYNNDE